MPRADTQHTTRDPHPPATVPTTPQGDTLPSLTDLYGLIVRLNDAHDRLDNAKLAKGKDIAFKEERLAEAAMQLAFDREDALLTLALTLPARTIQDAAAQLVLMDRQLHRLHNNEMGKHDRYIATRELVRSMASVLPVVAHAAGTTLNDLLGYEDYMIPHVLPDLGEGTR